jgi:hypothetical protein
MHASTQTTAPPEQRDRVRDPSGDAGLRGSERSGHQLGAGLVNGADQPALVLAGIGEPKLDPRCSSRRLTSTR